VAKRQIAGPSPESVSHGGGDDDSAERQVPARHALREGDQVGGQSPALDPVPVAKAAEAADHGVGDHEDALRATQLMHRLQVARLRGEQTTRRDYRLEEERGYAARPDTCELPLEGLDGLLLHPRDVRDQRAVAGLIRGNPREARAEAVGAVVAQGSRHDVPPLRAAQPAPVKPRELGCGVDGISAPAQKEDARVRVGRKGRKPRCQLESRLVRVVPEHVMRLQAAELCRHGVPDLASAVPDVRVPEPGAGVEVAPALPVPDPDTLAASHHDLPPRDDGHVGERVPQARVRGVHGLLRPASVYTD
jgi:hypothetical protein